MEADQGDFKNLFSVYEQNLTNYHKLEALYRQLEHQYGTLSDKYTSSKQSNDQLRKERDAANNKRQRVHRDLMTKQTS